MRQFSQKSQEPLIKKVKPVLFKKKKKKKIPIKIICVFYKFLLFSDHFSEVETFIWEDHIELDFSFFLYY